ncbi:MAG TPA: universal stress protein [Synergistaceae bacterium]|nr:universal stress protein [Synergistaceae bacterium]HPJ25738.1 universal stress protein [Synergistaceae bacterium]HPQ37814.1 universal stress protein [Synergistaceae bacterium]
MLRKILYPTDLSRLSQKGLAWTVEHVARKDSHITVLHVVNTVAGLNTPMLVQEAEMQMQSFEEELQRLDQPYTTITLAGDEMETIAEAAHGEGCSLSVLVVDREDDVLDLIRHVALPQVLVKSEDDILPEKPLGEKVLMATDLVSDRVHAMIQAYRQLMGSTSSKVTLVHVVSLEEAQSADALVTAANDALGTLANAISDSSTEVSTELLSGHPQEELEKMFRQHNPSLLVVGISQHGELWELLLGSTAEHLLTTASCPILIVPS